MTAPGPLTAALRSVMAERDTLSARVRQLQDEALHALWVARDDVKNARELKRARESLRRAKKLPAPKGGAA